MELPDDIIVLIKEYSRPLTRPDWRTLHHMPEFDFCVSLAKQYNKSMSKIYETTLDKNTRYKYMYCTKKFYPYIRFVYDPAYLYNNNKKYYHL